MGAAGVHDTGGERVWIIRAFQLRDAPCCVSSLSPPSVPSFISLSESLCLQASSPPQLSSRFSENQGNKHEKTTKHRHRNQTRTDDKDKITSILIRRPDNNVLITINYPPQCGNTRRCYQPPPLLQSYISGPLSYKIFDYVNISFPRHCASLGTPGPRLAFSKQTATFMNAFVMQHHTNISFHRKPFMMRRIT